MVNAFEGEEHWSDSCCTIIYHPGAEPESYSESSWCNFWCSRSPSRDVYELLAQRFSKKFSEVTSFEHNSQSWISMSACIEAKHNFSTLKHNRFRFVNNTTEKLETCEYCRFRCQCDISIPDFHSGDVKHEQKAHKFVRRPVG